MQTLAEEFGAQYVADYNRGWSAGRRATGLDALDARRASNAEYDGYLDAANEREKWHLPRCSDEVGHAEGCEVA